MQVTIPEDVIIKAVQQRYFRPMEAANYIGKSPATFKKWVTEYNIPVVNVDGQLLYDKEDLNKFFDSKKVK